MKRKEFPERKKLYNQGLTDREIAEELGIARSTVESWRLRRGLPVNKEDVSSKEFPERRELYNQGLTNREIAEELGESPSTIQGWRYSRGLPPTEKKLKIFP